MELLENAGWDLADENAIIRFLDSLPTRPRMLGLGEPTHGQDEFLRLRNSVFRRLVEHEGYRSIALESDILLGLAVDRYVTEGAGSLDEAMRVGFSHGFGRSQANRELVEWMREHNRGLPAEKRVRFFGFDAPLENTSAASPRQSLVALHGYLASIVDVPHELETIDRLIGEDARWTNEEVALNPSRGVGATDEAVRLRLIADDLHAMLTTEEPALAAASTPHERWLAHLHARTAVGLLRYHAVMTAEQSDERVSRMLGLRDGMMADNLSSIVDIAGPMLVFAQNTHLQRERSRLDVRDMKWRWWSAGATMSVRLGADYAFVATGVGIAPQLDLAEPEEGTMEGVLSRLPHDWSLVNARRFAAAGPPPLTQREGNWRYTPLHPEYLGNLDGIAFIRRLAPTGKPARAGDTEPSSGN